MFKKRVAVIGFGAITEEIVRCLTACGESKALIGVMDVPARVAEIRKNVKGEFPVVDSIDALLKLKPDIVVECAGHGAVKHCGPAVLQRGIDLMIASVGTLADRDFAAELCKTAGTRARVWIPSGAVAGIDGLLAARTAGLKSVTYTSLKPPHAWEGTPAAAKLNAAAKTRRTVLFEGTAREAATDYPQNANVGATIALAGLGLDRTRVVLASDPEVGGPLGIIDAEGEFGRFRFEILAYASPNNPKTSALTGHSIVCAFRDRLCFDGLAALAETERQASKS